MTTCLPSIAKPPGNDAYVIVFRSRLIRTFYSGGERMSRGRVISEKETVDVAVFRCDNRALLRESGAQSDIPPFRRTRLQRGKKRSAPSTRDLDYIIIYAI